jgi:hypothetical protein
VQSGKRLLGIIGRGVAHRRYRDAEIEADLDQRDDHRQRDRDTEILLRQKPRQQDVADEGEGHFRQIGEGQHRP